MSALPSAGSITLPASIREAALPDGEREYYARDVYRSGELPLAVVRPRSREQLRTLVVDAANAGLALVTRGGGASYTDAHFARTRAAILIDTGALDRVLSIDEADMIVTVEPGITWAALDAQLAARGLKVPFVGTFSGLAATVGGTVSQNANGHGSNASGISADSVIAVEVLTPRGEFLRPATAGSAERPSWFRNYGPDLTGLFLGDSGALGIKTAVVLKLLRRKPAFEAASFAFADFRKMHACMARLAGERIEDKSFGLDQALQQGQIARQDASTRWDVARSVWRSSPSALAGARSLVRMAAAGTRALAAALRMAAMLRA
jgi:FAD/FMN-containing dehydrogenase